MLLCAGPAGKAARRVESNPMAALLAICLLLCLNWMLAFHSNLTNAVPFAVFGLAGTLALVASRVAPSQAVRPLFLVGATVQAGLCFTQQFQVWIRHGLFDIFAFLIIGSISLVCVWALRPQAE